MPEISFKCKTFLILKKSKDSFARKKQRFKCEHCARSFSNENALKYHSDIHMGLENTCDVCRFQSTSARNLSRHSIVLHKTKDEITNVKNAT